MTLNTLKKSNKCRWRFTTNFIPWDEEVSS